MKKYKYTALALFATIMMASCTSDKGNYDYIPIEDFMPIKIGGIEPNYSFEYGSTATIIPELTGITDDQDLEYTWSLYNIGSGASKRDTIGRERNLNTVITQSVGAYTLIYTVKDKNKANTYVNAQSNIMVGTIFSNGWFVVEDNGVNTDVDLISVDDPATVREDIVTESIGTRLDGKAVKIVLNRKFNYLIENPDGTSTTVTSKFAFYICSQKDMKVFSAENMELFYNFEDCFYQAPAVRNIGNIYMSYSDMYLLNDGKSHYYSMMSSNVGKLPSATIGLADANTFINQKWFFNGMESLVFDDISKSFYRVQKSNTLFSTFKAPTDPNDDKGPVINTGKDLVDLIYWRRDYNSSTFESTHLNFAVMKDAQKSYLYKFTVKEASYPITNYWEYPLDSPLTAENSVRAMHAAQEVMFFTVNGNELHRYEIGKNYTPDQNPIVFPQGETVTFMRHFTFYNDESIDYLVVLTNTADGNWHLYTINFIGGVAEFDKDSIKLIASGKGTGRYVMRLWNNSEV